MPFLLRTARVAPLRNIPRELRDERIHGQGLAGHLRAQAVARRHASIRLLLVADDQHDVIHALRLLFSTRDLATLGATTPEEAISLAGAHSVDAALVDLNYEAGDTAGTQGLDLVSALHAHSPHLPIIVMTAWSTIDLALEAAKRGASDFV